MRVAGRGAASPSPQGQPGDLYISISIGDHPHFKRIGQDIETTLNLLPSEFILGGKFDVETPEGIKKLAVKAGMPSGTKLRLKGLGFEKSPTEKGDMYVDLRLTLPETLSSEQLDAARQLQEIGL